MRDLRIGNGIAACIMNYYEYTVTHGYKIDFLLNRNIASPYVDLAKKHGSRFYILPHDTSKPDKENINYIEEVVKNDYDILHVNLSGLNALIALEAARRAEVKQRIYHAHNPKESSSMKAKMRSLIYEVPSVWFANQYAACSTLAGDSIFGSRHYTVIKNAMDTSKFAFDETARKHLRKELGLEDKFVVGVVGRIVEQKNPYFTVDVFGEIKKRQKNAYLIWVGEGSLKEAVKASVREKGIEDCVNFLGTREDVNKLYSAMDVFLLPSKFEGLGIVYIEAQISGLQCFGSDHIPSDVEVSKNIHRIKLSKSAAEWANEIVAVEKNGQERHIIYNTGFEIDNVVDALCGLYE